MSALPSTAPRRSTRSGSRGASPARQAASLSTALLLAAGGAACAPDAITGPRALTPATRSAVALAPQCAADCVIVGDALPLRAAVAPQDSAAAPIRLGALRVVGGAGDSVTVVLDVSDSALAAAGPAVALTARVGETTQSWPLAQLRGGVTVHRFAGADTVAIEYTLSRTAVAMPALDARVRLVQASAGARVLEADLPWAPASGLRPARLAASVAASEDGSSDGGETTCYVDGPAPPPCGQTTITIAPEAGGGPFGGFQSGGGTGASAPIVVTFDAPASAVTVTALDPTYGGNGVSAYDASGRSAGGASFPGTGVPGQFSAPSASLSGEIARLVLTPAPNDYVAYRLTVTSGALDVVWRCEPSAARGADVTCRASTRSGRPFRVLSVGAFADPVRNVPIAVVERPIAVGAGQTWELGGTAVVTTRVTLAAEVQGEDGQYKSQPNVTSRFTVDARPWQMRREAATAYEVAGVTYEGTGLGSIYTGGAGGISTFEGIKARNVVAARVADGPNRGLSYVNREPVLPPSRVYLNPELFGGRWYDDQNGGTDPNTRAPRCTQASLPLLRANIARHEGIGRSDASHIAVEDRTTGPAVRTVEALWRTDAEGGVEQVKWGVRDTWADHWSVVVRPQQVAFDGADQANVWVRPFACVWDNDYRDP